MEAAAELIRRLEALETGQLSDVMDEAGLPNCVLDSALRPVTSTSPRCLLWLQ